LHAPIGETSGDEWQEKSERDRKKNLKKRTLKKHVLFPFISESKLQVVLLTAEHSVHRFTVGQIKSRWMIKNQCVDFHHRTLYIVSLVHFGRIVSIVESYNLLHVIN